MGMGYCQIAICRLRLNMLFAGTVTTVYLNEEERKSKVSNNWSLSFNSGYDFQAKEITQTSCTISRDLHCFNLSASLSPFGRWKYYNVTIRANASILQDLKYEKRSQT